MINQWSEIYKQNHGFFALDHLREPSPEKKMTGNISTVSMFQIFLQVGYYLLWFMSDLCRYLP